MRNSREPRVLLLVLLAACGAGEPPDPPGSWAFAALGDAPYGRTDLARFDRVIRQLNAESLTWVLHVGDILSPSCSDAVYADRLARFSEIRHPFIYTPGDNEWTDCHEPAAGRYEPLERLARLRQVFYHDPWASLGGRQLALESQAGDSVHRAYVENQRWMRDRFLFLTLHIVGSFNAQERFATRTTRDDVEVEQRTAAALAWLRDSFALASSRGARGVVIAIHANPAFERSRSHPDRAAFAPFLDALEEEVIGFAGPVLLIHGDTHRFKVDQPLTRRGTGETVRNLTRLEVHGSPHIGWVRVTIDTGHPGVFRFREHRVPRWMFW